MLKNNSGKPPGIMILCIRQFFLFTVNSSQETLLKYQLLITRIKTLQLKFNKADKGYD